MTVLISTLLILVGCIILIWGFLWLVYRIPLSIHLWFSKNNTILDFSLNINWGPVNTRILRKNAGWHFEGRICKKSVISRPISQITHEPEPAPETGEADKKPPIRNLIRFIPAASNLISELTHHITMDTFSADITFGAGDPVTTGCTYGYYHALRPLMTSKNCSITLTPDFDQLIFEGTLEGGILITTPASLIIRGTRLILPEVIQMRRGMYA